MYFWKKFNKKHITKINQLDPLIYEKEKNTAFTSK